MLHSLLITLTTSCLCQSPEPPLLDVAPLIRSLGGDFKSRTDATRKLAAMGEAARPDLTRAALDDDLETSRRAVMLLNWLDSDRRKRAVAMIDTLGVMPCIDFAWWDATNAFCADPQCRERLWPYYERAGIAADSRDVTKDGWWRYRSATRSLCVDMAEGGVPLVVIRAFLAELHGREVVFRKACGFPPFPVQQE